jgi:hypothetical protein
VVGVSKFQVVKVVILGQLELVQTLLGTITVPKEVWNELTVAGQGKPGASTIKQADWIESVALENKMLYTLLNKDLDDGEAAAIALAVEKMEYGYETVKAPFAITTPFTSWEALWRYVFDLLVQEIPLIILDEFPYLCSGNAALPTILQKIWDL